MAERVDSDSANWAAAPLRMQKPDGTTYRRPMEVRDALAVLLTMQPQEIAAHAQIPAPESPDYVRSECVLYFVRRLDHTKHAGALRDLFKVLRERVILAVPVPARPAKRLGKDGENFVDLEIRDAVLQKFQEMLCQDREEYEERLDFYECRFNKAVALLRATARKGSRKAASRYASSAYVSDSNEFTSEVEEALQTARNPTGVENFDFLYRSSLYLAISSLPPEERRVVELLFFEELPIHSKDPTVRTVASTLGCSEKTVRNRRDQALARLHEALRDEEAL